MGAGFGALIPITGVALTAFFIAPFLFAILANTVLKHIGRWFDVFGAFDRIGEFKLRRQGLGVADLGPDLGRACRSWPGCS